MKISAFSTLILGLFLLTLNTEEANAASSSMIVPINAPVTVPLGDGSNDEVTLNGKFHVVVGTSPSNSGSLLIHANLADVTSVISSSGSTYNAVGSTTIVQHTSASHSFTFYFKLIKFPPSPCLDSSSCNSENTASLFPLAIDFSVQQGGDFGIWSTTISCIGVAYPPSPCIESN